MKKIFPAIVLISILAVGLMPLATLAQVEGPQECCKIRRALKVEGVDYAAADIVGPTLTTGCTIGGVTTTVTKASDKWGVVCLMNTLNAATDWIFVILIAFVIIMVLIGGITLLTSAGDPAKVTSGRNYILYAAIGLIVAFLARAIPGIIKLVMGV